MVFFAINSRTDGWSRSRKGREREGRFTAIHFAVKPPRRFVRYIYASKSRSRQPSPMTTRASCNCRLRVSMCDVWYIWGPFGPLPWCPRQRSPHIGKYSPIAWLTLWPRIPINMACLKEKTNDNSNKDSWKEMILTNLRSIISWLKQ